MPMLYFTLENHRLLSATAGRQSSRGWWTVAGMASASTPVIAHG